MNFDWQGFYGRHPRLFAVLIALKRLRMIAAFVLAAYAIGEQFYNWEVPFDLDEPNGWVVVGLLLVGGGIGFRVAALGCLRRKEVLATSGVYSLCRHPLYLGSMLITFGFCCLLNDLENFALATAYFAVWYTLTIIWEEIRLEERYGDAHREYARVTPLILPFGRHRMGEFDIGLALSNGAAALCGVVASLLVAVEAMAETMR